MKKLALALSLVVAAMVVPFVVSNHQAEAAPYYARGEFEGYATGIWDDHGLDVIVGGLHPTDLAGQTCTESFISLVIGMANGGGSNQTGARYIILTMMGYPAGTGYAAADATVQNNWINTVRSYSTAGWISWGPNCTGTPQAYVENSLWQGAGGEADPDDVAWYNEPGATPDAIVFNNQNGTFYMIREECGNPIGGNAPLQQFNVNLSASSSPATAGPGETVTIVPTLQNTSGSSSIPGRLWVKHMAGLVAPAATQTDITAGMGTATGWGASGIPDPGASGGGWGWNTNAIPAGWTVSGSVTVTIDPAAPVGVITVPIFFYPGDVAGAVRTASISIAVITKRVPSIAGQNSDIHAGDCSEAPGSGYVTTNSSGNSYGQYVVSATSTLNNTKSNNTAADSLKIGQNGSYQQVCRPDLLKAAVDGGGGTVLTGNSYNLSTLTGSLYFWNGAGELQLSGPVNNKLTIVVPNGSVRITGNIAVNGGAFAPNALPSLGIISKGDIRINPAAVRVDAYLFSNAWIYTCDTGSPTICGGPGLGVLNMDGFLMAKNIVFGRLGAYNTNSTSGTPQYSEIIRLSPQIYLNPPKYFDGSVDPRQLQGQGEKPPLY